MRKLALAMSGAMLLLFGAASAEECMHAEQDSMAVMPADAIVWGPAPPGLPPGSKAVVLAGNPGVQGTFTIRAWMPAGYKVPPHWHPAVENVTVISGTLHVGMGDALDATKANTLGAGGFVHLPAEMHHWAYVDGETVLQIQGEGPFAINYLNPADDPRQPMPEKK